MAVAVRAFTPDEWELFRDLRLRALLDAPDSFTSTYAREAAFDEQTWRARTAPMAYATAEDAPAGIVGAMPVDDDALVLVAMWVAPEHRGSGVADALAAWVVDEARRLGRTRVGLWYTDGNEAARRLYTRVGFVEVDDPGSLPGRLEECDHAMVLDVQPYRVPVDDILVALAAQHAELAVLVDACTDDDWERSTRCEGWDVAAVLLHLAQTDEFATTSAHGDFDGFSSGLLGSRDQQTVSVDDAVAAQVDAERASGGDAIRRRWHDASQEMRAAFAAGDPHRRVTWVSGQLSLQTLAATRLSECWIHTGDIASALGVEPQPTDRLRHIARLAWRTLPYAFERADTAMNGPVALDLIGPNGEQWRFDPDAPALTTIRGSAAEFCDVATRRVEPEATGLVGDGPDTAAVLRVVRTYAL